MSAPLASTRAGAVLLAIDPGYDKRGPGCAVAVFLEGVLAQAFFARPETVLLSTKPDTVVWEQPQVDARTRMSTPAVVKLSAVGGMLAGMYASHGGCRAEGVPPLAWKGSVPKPVCHGRLWAKLSDRERDLFGPGTLEVIEAAKIKGAKERWGKPGAAYYPASFWAHNLLDAVGLGVWKLGR